MKKYLQKISDDFALLTNAITQKFAWIGTSGGGKSYAATEFAEVLWDAGGQFVVLDPVGIWYGLRLDKSGKKPSHINIPVFGGLHGDVPLEPASGALIADLIIDRDICAIIDVSQFEFDTDKARFATAFAARFFFRKKSAPSAVHIFLEECQEFVPQVPQRGEEKMLHEFTRMQKIGRNFGIGMSLITQRPQEVSKRVLNLSSTLFAFRTTGSHEREAIEKWMKDIHAEDDFLNDLPKLETGCPYLWSPEYLKISKVVKILPKKTFDASATPEIGAKSIVRHLAPIDLEKIKTEMAATIEKAKAEDPKELQKIIAGLRKEIASGPKTITKEAGPMGVSQWRDYGMKYGYWDFWTKKVAEDARANAEKLIKQYIVFINKMLHLTGERAKAILDGVEQLKKQMPEEHPAYVVETPKIERTLPEGEKKILAILIDAHPNAVERDVLSDQTGYQRSSRDAYLQRLSARELVVQEGRGMVRASDNLF